MGEPRSVALIDARVLTPSVRELRLRCVDRAPLGFRAGQWVHVHMTTPDRSESRAYSIASAPDAATPDVFEIAVTRVEGGPVSSWLHDLPVGETLVVDGPHGFFTLDDVPGPKVFVGTGTGLAPLRSMISERLRAAPGLEGTLLFGCRTQQDVLWRDEMLRWERAAPGFRAEITLSQPDAAWAGRRGYVQHHLEDVVGRYDRPHVYVCGLSTMVGEVRTTLKTRLGFDRKHVHSERYD